MNWIETILIVLVILSVIVTFVREPVLSIKYGKEVVTSGKNVIVGGINILKSISVTQTNSTGVNETWNQSLSSSA